MGTLMLRLAAPLQAWGTESKFDIRQTGKEPSKSGVIGLLAAALGRKRDADLSDLSHLKFGVRVDKEGKLLRDFQMVQEKVKKPYLTNRYYLADAVFLVALECEDDAFLADIEEALKTPAYPLFLGRRSCPPTLPLVLGIRDTDLLTALYQEPALTKKDGEIIRIVTEALPGDDAYARVKDVPVSFSPYHREYRYRKSVERALFREILNEEHDPMSELR